MTSILVATLLAPETFAGMDASQHQQLISQGRSTHLLGSLRYALQQAGVLEAAPQQVKRHLDSAWLVYSKTKRDIDYEVAELTQTLQSAGERLILLKGAAYIKADLPSSLGRKLSDVDILTPESSIAKVEDALHAAGWHSGKLDPYNERYYRKWMHEIPPLVHPRGTVLDLHHTILPPTASPNVDASLLFAELVEVKPGIFTLSPCDMVIHSAAHLFHEGEFQHGLRDLWDLDRMLRSFSEKNPHFWERLAVRARALDLEDSLFHSLNYSQQIFQTPVPATVTRQVQSWARLARKPLMDFLFRRAFQPNHPACRLPFTGFALYLLYMRSHYLRMPLYLLLPHLARKAWMSRFDNPEIPDDAEKKTEAQHRTTLAD